MNTTMKKIEISETLKSPYVNFDAQTGTIELRGRSILNNAKDFYQPLIEDWLEEYMTKAQKLTTVNIAFDFFNTSTSMWLMHLLKKMVKLSEINNVHINWYYPDEDIKEMGEEYMKLIPLKFTMIEIESNF